MNNKQRLLDIISPREYNILLKPDLQSFTFLGEETIEFEIKKPTKKLIFHAVEITITKAKLTFGKNSFTPKISYGKEGTVTFAINKELSVGEYALRLSYKGLLGEKMKGWYRSEYIKENKKHYLAATQFEEIGARQALVCIDEPSAKAIFHVTLVIPKNLVGISNTIVVKEEEIQNKKKLYFAPTPRMSSYLLAFVVGEFDSIATKSKHNVTVRAFATPGKKKQLEFALDTAAKCLDFYEDYFAISYPLPVLDLIALPDFDAGAMENWGAVTFREAALFVDQEKSSLANQQWVALVVAHELAHMWFGNLVTMQWWTYLWLNEGFACYIEYLATNAIFPKWDMWKQFSVTEHASALALDGLASSHPIEVSIEKESEVKEIFDEISYAKGANVIQMLATFLGANIFRDGLRKYLKDNAYGNTTTEKLWEAFEAVSGQPVTKIMHNWTKKTGYPLITVSQKNNFYSLSQERFFSSPIERKKNKTTTIWEVPLRIVEPKDTKKLLLEKAKIVYKTKSHWIKVNAGETGLVRTVYEENVYKVLGPIIASKQLEAVDRMGIIRDAFDASEAGLLSSVELLKLVSFYRAEDEYIVWASISSGLSSLDNIVEHLESSVQLQFDEFGQMVFQNIARKMGWEKKSTDSHTDILLRSIALSSMGRYKDKDTIEKARELFALHLEGKLIDSDIRGVVFSLVARNGGEKEWSQFYSLYEKEDSQQEKGRLMMALSMFEDPTLITKTLDWSFSDISLRGQVRLQDKSRILRLLYMNPKAQRLTWEFVKSHWPEYKKMYKGLHGFTEVIDGAGYIVEKTLEKDISNFFTKHKEEELERTIKQVMEKIGANIAWLQRDRVAIEKFLQSKV